MITTQELMQASQNDLLEFPGIDMDEKGQHQMNTQELIERAKEQRDRDAAEHCPAEIIELQDQMIEALQALQAENAANMDTCKGIIKGLQAEVERLTACLKTANSNHEEFERKWYLACDEVDALKPDAGRYRWLRNRLYFANVDVGEAYITMKVVGSCPSEKTIDAAIDAAVDAAKGNV